MTPEVSRPPYHVDSDRGLDGNKKIKGQKQHIIVDTQGNLMAIAVHEANVHDSKGAPEVIKHLSYKFPRLAKILADGGYRGNLADGILDKFGWELEVALRPDKCPSKFKVLPRTILCVAGKLQKAYYRLRVLC